MTDDLVKRLRSPTGPFNWEDAVATYLEAADRIEKLEDALQAIVDDEVPRGVTIPYRDDGFPSKHDRCAHHEWMYNYCAYCIMEYAKKALGKSHAPQEPV
jgi:hypothetical protein